MKYLPLISLLLLTACNGKNPAIEAAFNESCTLTEQTEDSILNYSQKAADLNISDPVISNNIDQALKYVRMKQDFENVWN